jgi:nucleoside-diphosphate-sugar epimerase
MHVLVTGATGFIGFHTALALLQAGHSVRFGVRSENKLRRLCQPLDIDISDRSVGEITDRSVIDAALDGVDGVVHTAALVSMDASRAEAMYQTNTVGTERVIGGAVARGLKSIVNVSSVTALYHPEAGLLDETRALADPTSPYGRSKAAGERFVRRLLAEGASIASTFPATVIGPMDPAMSEGNQGLALQLRFGVVRTSSGLQMVDVRDLADAQVALLERRASGPWIVGGHYRSWDELGPLLERVTGRHLRRLPIPGWMLRGMGTAADLVSSVLPLQPPLGREGTEYATRWVYADDRKLREALGMRYRPLEETLVDTIRWMAEAGRVDPWWAQRLLSPAQIPR